MNHKYCLALDPSGNFYEGKGTTGWVLMEISTGKICKFGAICASNFNTQAEYWEAHIELIIGLSGFKPIVVIEDFLLYADKAKSQINSKFETPQLIGVIKYECFKMNIKTYLQPAVRVKKRWEEKILVHKGYLTKKGNHYYINRKHLVVGHIRDALKHAVHYKVFVHKEEED